MEAEGETISFVTSEEENDLHGIHTEKHALAMGLSAPHDGPGPVPHIFSIARARLSVSV